MDSTCISALPHGDHEQHRVVLETNEMRRPTGAPAVAASPVVPRNAMPGDIDMALASLAALQTGHRSQTQLPSRDIPMETNQLTQDPQTQPNYVPAAEETDYIAEHDSAESIKKKEKESTKEQDRLDSLYAEMQTPLIVMALFFFFQMPYFQKKLGHVFPSLFLKDGNPNVRGYLAKTALFGAVFFVITKVTQRISET